jgi:hypothetical protein
METHGNVRFGVLVAKASASVTERHEKIKIQFYTTSNIGI